MFELFFCMNGFVDFEEMINCWVEDKMLFELNVYDVNMFVIDMYNVFVDLIDLECFNKGINIFFMKLVNIELLDWFIKDFMVIKILMIKSLLYLENLDKIFESYRDKIFGNFCIVVLINFRLFKYFIYWNMIDVIDFIYGIIYIYVNFVRYSFREVVECLNNV